MKAFLKYLSQPTADGEKPKGTIEDVFNTNPFWHLILLVILIISSFLATLIL